VSNTSDNAQSDERTLVSRLKQGHEGAFRILVEQYQKQVFRIAYGITLDREESLDIVQDVFLKVHQNISGFEGKAKLSTWIHRITVNQCLNWQRRWKRRFRWHHEPLETENGADRIELASDEEKPETRYQTKEMENVFREKLRELPEDARAVFVLKELEGYSYDEIAHQLKIKRGTVSSRLFYARRKLKELLSDYVDRT